MDDDGDERHLVTAVCQPITDSSVFIRDEAYVKFYLLSFLLTNCPMVSIQARL